MLTRLKIRLVSVIIRLVAETVGFVILAVAQPVLRLL